MNRSDFPGGRIVGWRVSSTMLEPIGNIPPAEAEPNYYREFMESEEKV